MAGSENGNGAGGKLDRVLVEERDLKRVMLSSAGAILTAVVIGSAAGIWSTNNRLNRIETWQEKHDANYVHGMEEIHTLNTRVKDLESFAARGDRYTRQDGDKIELRVRALENVSIRIEAKLDAILDKISGVNSGPRSARKP